MKNQKGITLIALVVTIVVLLILAAVSIAMLRGDSGIITNANNAKYANVQGEVIDKMNLAYNAVKTEIKVKQATDSSATGYNAVTDISNLETLINNELSDNKYTVEVDDEEGSTGNKIVTITYSDDYFGTGLKYGSIVCTIKITPDDAVLDPKTDNPNRPYNPNGTQSGGDTTGGDTTGGDTTTNP